MLNPSIFSRLTNPTQLTGREGLRGVAPESRGEGKDVCKKAALGPTSSAGGSTAGGPSGAVQVRPWFGSCEQVPPSGFGCPLWGWSRWVWSRGHAAAASVSQPVPRPRALAGSLERAPEETGGQRGKTMTCVPQQPPPAHPRCVVSAGCPLTGDGGVSWPSAHPQFPRHVEGQ